MSRVFNFSAGPAALPEEVLKQAADEMLDWHGSGQSVMEMSHRGKEFISIHAEAEKDLRELLAVPPNYKVLFLQGGAIAENAIVPMNMLRGRSVADYVNTGEWSKKSIKEAKKYCSVNIAASSSSVSKGESLVDTVRTVQALGARRGRRLRADDLARIAAAAAERSFVEVVAGASPYAATDANVGAIIESLSGLLAWAERESVRRVGLGDIPELFAA